MFFLNFYYFVVMKYKRLSLMSMISLGRDGFHQGGEGL